MALLVVLASLQPSALLLGGVAPTTTAHRSLAVRCCDVPETIDVSAADPSQLADAWRRDEKAKELIEMLKGCSIYVMGTLRTEPKI